jgi:hypothetical protein
MNPKLLLMYCLFAGCALFRGPQNPVSLTLPPPGASYEERLAAYNKLAPKQAGVIVVTYSNGGSSRTPYVTLQDNLNYFNPTTLLKVLSEDTPTAKLVAERDTAWQKRRVFFLSGLAALGAGTLLLGSAELAQNDSVAVASLLGSGVLSVGGVASILVGTTWRFKGSTANERALLTYDFSLRKTLGVCYDDLKDVVYDCENPPDYLPY